MTIGIGVLGTDKKAMDSLVFLTDTQGSFGGAYSMNRLHKTFKAPELDLYAIGADQIDRAAELFEFVKQGVGGHPNRGAYGSLLDATHAASDCYKRGRFRYDVLLKYARHPDSLPEGFDDTHLTPPLLEEWQKYYVGCQLIVGSFNSGGQAYLFFIDGSGNAENFSFPGYAAIGSGADNAMFWLSYRQHHLGKSLKNSIYHAFEAKIMAESSPYVNDKLDILVAQQGGHYYSIGDFSPPVETPMTIAALREMFMEYGPRSTEGLTPWKEAYEIYQAAKVERDAKQ